MHEKVNPELVKGYLKKVHAIRQNELFSVSLLLKKIGINHNTWHKVNENPDQCSYTTARKIKCFVDSWNITDHIRSED